MNIECYNFTLSLSDIVLNIFKKHVQYDVHLPESGGILTGKLYEDLVEILNCSEPTVSDKQSRYNFNRSYKAAQIFINEKFEKSKGKEIYLGEWHTHPEDNPTPSVTDIKNFTKTISKNKLNSNTHFMIIIGIKSIYIGIYTERKLIENKNFIIE
ncbi:Mov34/MPN/PAD-1 family protein [Myroides sp. N17-2]|uniref:Mov34/MPN/PAD-1 family protein n=1 Tax=Myroides sp. N17-2 TaxID=2030799 RepID=UPI000EFC2783|nr:Mov34/MPN/PAD-1 family protein [Myroides sp. N17-2]